MGGGWLFIGNRQQGGGLCFMRQKCGLGGVCARPALLSGKVTLGLGRRYSAIGLGVHITTLWELRQSGRGKRGRLESDETA